MRPLIALLFVLLNFWSQAQQWTVINGVDYYSQGFVGGSGGGWNINNKQFKINPFDNSIWFGNQNIVHGFDTNGNYFYFDETIDPAFNGNVNVSTVLEFTFTPTRTFLVDNGNGVLEFDGVNWTQLSGLIGNYHISSDNDTVWVSRSNVGSHQSILNGVVTNENMYNLSKIERIQSRNGDFWVCTDLYDGILLRKVNNSFEPFNADTIAHLLDNTNYDFKFSRDSDTLYTSGDRGISLAYNGEFIDTITRHNTFNMPGDTILEFEFDHLDNIWALFGTAYDKIRHLAYLDRNSNSWTMVYDEFNSPIPFDAIGRKSLEIDSAGNVYVTANWNLYVLKLNNWPTWLGENKLSLDVDKKVVGVYDLLGRETEDKINTVLIYEYSDGTTERIFRVK